MHARRSSALALALVGGFGLVAASNAAAAQTAKLYQGSLSIHYFAIDGAGPGGADRFSALPLGTFCNPDVSRGRTCDLSETLHAGAPLTGSGTASVTGSSPASLLLPPLQLKRITSGSLPPRYRSNVYRNTYADLANAAGAFRAGGGPGDYVLSVPPPTGLGGTRVAISPGKNQFGGVMRLLKGSPSGGLGTKARYHVRFEVYYTTTVTCPSLGATLLGGRTSQGFALPVTGTVVGTAHAKVSGTPVSTRTFESRVIGWPWTTGTVTVSAFGDYLYHPDGSGVIYPPFWATQLRRAGYDNRTPSGSGTIQLVAPHLTMIVAGTLRQGEVGVLRLQFAPEPGSLLLLVAGVGLLMVLYRWRAVTADASEPR